MTDQDFFEKCDNLERRIKQLEAIVGKIEAENEPEFERVSHGEPYFYIYGNTMNVAVTSEDSDYTSDTSYINNNYFYTKERAQEVANKIKFLLKLERLHDIYCSHYKPDWNSIERKYQVYFDYSRMKYNWETFSHSEYAGAIYFPTQEIVQKVCDILNKELE